MLYVINHTLYTLNNESVKAWCKHRSESFIVGFYFVQMHYSRK